MRTFRVLGVGAVVLVSAACARAAMPTQGGGGSPAASSAVLTLQAGQQEPNGTLSFGSETARGTVGSMCWEVQGDGLETRCIDTSGEEMLGTPAVTLPSGTEIMLKSDAASVDAWFGTVSQDSNFPEFLALGSLDFSSGSARVSAEPGSYVLKVVGNWPQGQGLLFFPFSVS